MYTFRVLVLRPCLYNREGSLSPQISSSHVYMMKLKQTLEGGGGVVLYFSLNTNAQG